MVACTISKAGNTVPAATLWPLFRRRGLGGKPWQENRDGLGQNRGSLTQDTQTSPGSASSHRSGRGRCQSRGRKRGGGEAETAGGSPTVREVEFLGRIFIERAGGSDASRALAWPHTYIMSNKRHRKRWQSALGVPSWTYSYRH